MALFFVSSGITIMQVAANPFVAVLGEPEGAASRLNLAQAVNKFGYAMAPYIGTFFILNDLRPDEHALSLYSPQQLEIYKSSQASAVQTPYLILTGILLILIFFVYKSNLPNLKEASQTD